MGLRIWAFVTTHWNDAADAARKGEPPLGLKLWHQRVQRYLSPEHCFLACGTWSEPSFSPLPIAVNVVNAGIPLGTPYNVWYTQLASCAFTAAMAYALRHSDKWDLLACLDTDILLGAVDFNMLIREFVHRSEIMLAQAWGSGIGGAFYVWKPAGAVRFLHGRLRANIIEPPMLLEDELAAIYKGCFWNPWPGCKTMRQDFGLSDPRPDSEAMLWPFVGRPSPTIIAEYERTQTPLAKPLQP